MKQTKNIFHDGSLFEISFSGTTVLSIRQFFAGSGSYRDLRYNNLPTKVKDQLIKELKKQQLKLKQNDNIKSTVDNSTSERGHVNDSGDT